MLEIAFKVGTHFFDCKKNPFVALLLLLRAWNWRCRDSERERYCTPAAPAWRRKKWVTSNAYIPLTRTIFRTPRFLIDADFRVRSELRFEQAVSQLSRLEASLQSVTTTDARGRNYLEFVFSVLVRIEGESSHFTFSRARLKIVSEK